MNIVNFIPILADCTRFHSIIDVPILFFSRVVVTGESPKGWKLGRGNY